MASTVKISTGNDDQDARLSKMQDLIEDRSRFRGNDIELLRTGQFSDAEVVVGGRTWKVHKCIVCSRSGFLAQALSGQSEAAETATIYIWHHTERLVEFLFEFIYSGRIETIDDLNFADCVQLSMLGEQFAVDGMEMYGKKALWRKLAPYIEPNFTVPGFQNTGLFGNTVTIDVRKLSFDLDFKGAVQEAYGGSGQSCQLLLADFIWMARGWLLHDPIIENLNTAYPLLGSHILATLTKGPQSSFVRADAQLMSTANNSAGALSTNRPQARLMGAPKQGSLGLFGPRRF